MSNNDLAWHGRGLLRRSDHDYAGGGLYFVTICSYERICLFGEIVNDAVQLSDAGAVVDDCWRAIPDHFAHAVLDDWVVMPNHIHGVLAVGARHASPNSSASPTSHAAPKAHGALRAPLGTVVGSCKSAVTRGINEMRRTPGGRVWQRNYHDHIIRDEADLFRVRQYVAENPSRWAEDEENPSA